MSDPSQEILSNLVKHSPHVDFGDRKLDRESSLAAIGQLPSCIETLRLGDVDFPGLCPFILRRLPVLKKLDMEFMYITDDEANMMLRMDLLEELCVSIFSPSITTIQALCHRLAHLKLHCAEIEDDCEVFISDCKRLQSLELSISSVAKQTAVVDCNRLRSLVIKLPKDNCKPDPMLGMDLIQRTLPEVVPPTISVAWCESLESLYLEGPIAEGTVMQGLPSLRSLTTLDLGLSWREDIPQSLEHLHVLRAWNSNLVMADVMGCCSRLVSLHLASIDDDVTVRSPSLTSIKCVWERSQKRVQLGCPQLQSLYVKNGTFHFPEDDCKSTKLQSLTINGCDDLSDSALRELLPSCPTISSLSIEFCDHLRIIDLSSLNTLVHLKFHECPHLRLVVAAKGLSLLQHVEIVGAHRAFDTVALAAIVPPSAKTVIR